MLSVECAGGHFGVAAAVRRVRVRGPAAEEVVRPRPLFRRPSTPLQPAGAGRLSLDPIIVVLFSKLHILRKYIFTLNTCFSDVLHNLDICF